ncbi:MAG: M28 family peptidase [Bacteroidetes bacterium]|nr:M28 family peptidase [Bacteroidota bacterium]
MKKLTSILALALLIASCKDEKPPQTDVKTDVKEATKPTLISPDFNEDSAYRYIEHQVAFGFRNPGSIGHAHCAEWLLSQLKRFTPDAQIYTSPVKAFDGKTFTAKNIIASFNKNNPKRILLAAHWDSRPFADQDQTGQDKPIVAANDGGSGVGVLLEIARQMSLKPTDVGIDIILFDIEDYGQPQGSKFPDMEDSYCLGSQAWAKKPHVANYKAYMGILLDMVGAPGAKFAQEGTSLEQATPEVTKIWETANRIGFPNFVYYKKSPIIDDHYYVNKYLHIPMVDIIEYDATTPSGFSKTWHTHNDVIENISKETLNSVGQTVMEVIYYEK